MCDKTLLSHAPKRVNKNVVILYIGDAVVNSKRVPPKGVLWRNRRDIHSNKYQLFPEDKRNYDLNRIFSNLNTSPSDPGHSDVNVKTIKKVAHIFSVATKCRTGHIAITTSRGVICREVFIF
ncbi:hypothetical protein GWI33_015390 [Rhynchophorus ferrugineus]|uniref:Uncharacterized protein n=1 Tax=Rhynchophorus ferrugineus TaxID=354439 RepID=A0A834M854_RHYFE|nr:hypothetical protein GWI33_015390 [Rhynchophorus ferrugineus]